MYVRLSSILYVLLKGNILGSGSEAVQYRRPWRYIWSIKLLTLQTYRTYFSYLHTVQFGLLYGLDGLTNRNRIEIHRNSTCCKN
jgi:hypothetical protein